MDRSPPGSSVHGILHARILEWVAISFSRRSSWPRDRSCIFCISCIAGRFFSEKGGQEEMVGWHHQLHAHESEQTPRDNERQGSLVCCSPWGCKESDMTELLNKNNTLFKVPPPLLPLCLLPSSATQLGKRCQGGVFYFPGADPGSWKLGFTLLSPTSVLLINLFLKRVKNWWGGVLGHLFNDLFLLKKRKEKN